MSRAFTRPSAEVDRALSYHVDEQLSDEVWLAPGISLCQGRKYLYLNTHREDGALAVLPVTWLPRELVDRELALRAGLKPRELEERMNRGPSPWRPPHVP